MSDIGLLGIGVWVHRGIDLSLQLFNYYNKSLDILLWHCTSLNCMRWIMNGITLDEVECMLMLNFDWLYCQVIKWIACWD